jgi:hypothetical protein
MSSPKRLTNNTSSYHFVGTQKSEQRPNKSQKPTKLTQQIVNSSKKTKKIVYTNAQGTKAYVHSLKTDIMRMYMTIKG